VDREKMPIQCPHCGASYIKFSDGKCSDCGAWVKKPPHLSPKDIPMRHIKCGNCLFSFTEADRVWDEARQSGNCPSCGSPLDQFSDVHQRSTQIICSACGSTLEPNDRFCSQCGSAIARTVTISDGKQRSRVPDSSSRSTSMPVVDSTNASRKIATRWLSFYTYAFLPFRILTSFVPLLAEYDRLVEQGYKAELNLLMFAPIVVWNIFICFLIYGLHKKKFWGWVCNWIFLGAVVLLSPVYYKISFGAYLVAVMLSLLIFFLPNFIYFKKRRFLFD
jgi:DNA-directed RNA polymerase subunit RPC12/RpoP